jgi:phosphoribosylaminoimidazole-succinocarboxamide synthase
MTPEFVESVSQRYIELYEHITGSKFVPAPEANLNERIAQNVTNCLKSL